MLTTSDLLSMNTSYLHFEPFKHASGFTAMDYGFFVCVACVLTYLINFVFNNWEKK